MPTYNITIGDSTYAVDSKKELTDAEAYGRAMGFINQSAKDEPSIARQIEFGFDSTNSDVQNWASIAESYLPLGNVDFSLEDGFSYYSPEELYGEGFMDASQEERLEIIEQKRKEAIETEYADIYKQGLEESGWSTVGSFGGVLASPTTLSPVGRTLKAAAGIGAALGAETAIAEGLAKEGKVDLGNTVVAASLGGVLAPAAIAAGRGIQSVRAKKKSAKLVKEADAQVDEIENLYHKAVIEDVPVSDLNKFVAKELDTTEEAIQSIIGIASKKPMIPSKATAKFAEAVPAHGVDSVARAKFPFLDDAISVLSTRVGNISKPIKMALRKVDMEGHINTHKGLEVAEPFKKVVKTIPKEQRPKFNKALLNGDFGVVTNILKGAKNVVVKRTIDGKRQNVEVTPQKAWDDLNGYLKETHGNLKAAGYKDLGEIENYFPRALLDKDGLRASLGIKAATNIERALAARAKQLNLKSVKELPATEEEKIINNVARGYLPKIDGGGISFTKGRQIERLTDDLVPFYADPMTGLDDYIRGVSHNIAKRRFFGLNAVHASDDALDVERSIDSIGAAIAGKQKLTAAQEDELRSLLNARFISGEKGGARSIQALRNVGYITTLANPLSATTQLADLSIAAYTQGIRNTLGGMFGKSRITMQQMGLDDVVAQEFSNENVLAHSMHKLFTISGFRAMDKLGKNTVLNAALKRAEKLSKSDAGSAVIAKKYKSSFGDEFDSLMDDFRAGKITDNVKLYLWSELADVQPISLSEMPKKWLDAPNGRIFYALKTFAIKQLDIMRRTIYQQWKDGNKATAVRNAVAFSLLVPTANMATQEAKNFMLGREMSKPEDLPDAYMDNILRLFGASDYLVEKKIAKGKIFESGLDLIAPPLGYIDAIATDLADAYKVLKDDDIDAKFRGKVFKELPIAGKFIYNYFQGGIEKFEERREKERDER
jgi:hypothetical protein